MMRERERRERERERERERGGSPSINLMPSCRFSHSPTVRFNGRGGAPSMVAQNGGIVIGIGRMYYVWLTTSESDPTG